MSADPNPPQGTRRYRSALREAQAGHTRESILEAARALFTTGGFSATTITAIAERADVASQTVYATFGSKLNVARAIVEQMEESTDSTVWRERIAVEQDPRRILHAFSAWTAAFFGASMPELSIASELTAEASDMVAQGNARRREALTSLIDRIAEHGSLRSDISPADAVDRAWMLTGIETFMNATHACGWPPEKYVEWLAETLAQQILTPLESQRPDANDRA